MAHFLLKDKLQLVAFLHAKINAVTDTVWQIILSNCKANLVHLIILIIWLCDFQN